MVIQSYIHTSHSPTAHDDPQPSPKPLPLTQAPSLSPWNPLETYSLSITLATGIGIFTSSVYPPHHSPSSSQVPVCSTCMYTRLLHIGVGENRYQNHGPCHFGVYKLRTIKARRRWGGRKNIKDLVGGREQKKWGWRGVKRRNERRETEEF